MAISGHLDSKISSHIPPAVGAEMRTLLNANGGGVPQSAVSPALERHIGAVFGHEVQAEMVSLLNSVGKGVSKQASQAVQTRVFNTLGAAAGGEMMTILGAIS